MVATQEKVTKIKESSKIKNRSNLCERKFLINSITTQIKEVQHLSSKILGKGNFGYVLKGTLRSNHKIKRAIKIIPKNKIQDIKLFKKEINIMRNVDHPNIIKLYDTFEDKRNIQLVMELCIGGELFDRIVDNGNFTEADSKLIFKQIIYAIYQLHDIKIVHRNLKPGNFMYQDKSKYSVIKLINFGLSKIQTTKQQSKTKCETLIQMAPEILTNKHYTNKCDIYSIGIILQVLLAGYHPYMGANKDEIIKHVDDDIISFPGIDWGNISFKVIDLIKKLTNKNIDDRINAQDAIKHGWLSNPKSQQQQYMTIKNIIKNKCMSRCSNNVCM